MYGDDEGNARTCIICVPRVRRVNIGVEKKRKEEKTRYTSSQAGTVYSFYCSEIRVKIAAGGGTESRARISSRIIAISRERPRALFRFNCIPWERRAKSRYIGTSLIRKNHPGLVKIFLRESNFTQPSQSAEVFALKVVSEDSQKLQRSRRAGDFSSDS